jgi:hypothetical protein
MAVLDCKEIHEGRRGSVNEKGVREYTRMFQVITDSPTTSIAEVGDAFGMPRIGDFYVTGTESDEGATLRRILPNQNPEAPEWWTVTCEYSSASEAVQNPQGTVDPFEHFGGAAGGGGNATGQRGAPEERDPLLRPIEFSVNGTLFQKSTNGRDYSGLSIRMSTGEYPVGLPEIDAPQCTYTFTRNEAILPEDNIRTYLNTTNLNVFRGWQPNECKMQSIAGVWCFERKQGLALVYARVTYVIHCSRDGWNLKIFDRGFHHRISATSSTTTLGSIIWTIGASNTLLLNRDPQGTPYAAPQYLDGAGQLLPPNGTPVEKSYQVYKQLSWAPLALPGGG